jgi:hypothetical protein
MYSHPEGMGQVGVKRQLTRMCTGQQAVPGCAALLCTPIAVCLQSSKVGLPVQLGCMLSSSLVLSRTASHVW